MRSLVFQANDYRDLREHLLSHSPLEAGALLIAGNANAEGSQRLLVREVIEVPPSGYLEQAEARLVIAPEFLAIHLKRARLEGWSLILAHSHPFNGRVAFSAQDDSGERRLLPSIFGRVPGRSHGALVIGPTGFDARVWTSLDERNPVGAISEIGRDVRRYNKTPKAALADEDRVDSIFDRNVRAFGNAGQQVLQQLRVAVVGLGGMGSIIAEELAHLGVGHLVLLDPDFVEASNLNRVVGSDRSSVGLSKVDVAASMIRRIRGGDSATPLRGSALVRDEALSLLSVDFIFCCTDSHGSRAVLNQLAYQYLIPIIDTGVRIDARHGKVTSVVGRTQMLAPGLPCLTCQRLLDAEEVRRDLLADAERARDPYIVGSAEPQPSVVSLNGTIASLAVTMFLASVTGLPFSARHQIYLADRGVVRAAESAPQPNCVVCSAKGALARGDEWPLPWRLQ